MGRNKWTNELFKKRFDIVENWANKNKVKIFGWIWITKEAPEASRRAWIKAVREEAENETFHGLIGSLLLDLVYTIKLKGIGIEIY